jgi:ribosomal protein S12 methylthiotransferase
MPIKVGFVSLGCPKNLINTENMIAKCHEAGYEIVAEDIDADVMVINTCAFIKSAKEEAIENILDVAWLKKNRNLKGIVVAGCLAERYRDEIFKEMPEVDSVIGTGSYDEVVDAIENAYNSKRFISCRRPEELAFNKDRVVTTPSHYAYVQIAEGCDNRCTYCIIPSLRGKYRSRPVNEIVEEVTDLARLGVKEIILVAQDTTLYGIDLYGKACLEKLISALSEIDGIEWIRVLYCYPERITDEIINEFATNQKLVKYIDMPIQHINDNVLKRMNRKGTSAAIREVIAKIRKNVPDIVIRTTLIVGFPGETEDDFAELYDFVKETNFDRLGVFSYSREEDTPAYNFPDQIPDKTKKKRLDKIMRLQMGIHEENNKAKVGKTVEVICEGYDPVAEKFFGRSQWDCPDIDGKVYFNSSKNIQEGEFVNVKITDFLDYDLLGVAVINPQQKGKEQP